MAKAKAATTTTGEEKFRLSYKCAHCGDRLDGPGVPFSEKMGAGAAAQELARMFRPGSGIYAGIAHFCDDGNVGLAYVEGFLKPPRRRVYLAKSGSCKPEIRTKRKGGNGEASQDAS